MKKPTLNVSDVVILGLTFWGVLIVHQAFTAPKVAVYMKPKTKAPEAK